MPAKLKNIEEVFWSRLRVGGPYECWPFSEPYDRQGYARAEAGHKIYRLHNYALQRKLGRPLLPGKIACHTCDNPGCGNPTHLYEGTHKTNAEDRKNRGRSNHYRAPPKEQKITKDRKRFSDFQIKEIRRWKAHGMTYQQIAEAFGTGSTTIEHIVKRHTYKGVP